MHWKHYWRNVITHYHIVIEGWLDDIPFKNLSEVSLSLPALESLLRKLEAGKIYWKAISCKEYKEMEADCNARLEDGTVKLLSPYHTCSDKGKRSQCSRPTDNGEESDNDSKSGSEHPNKTIKKARHHRKVSNSGNLMSSSDRDAARDREVHGSQIDNDNDNTAEQGATSTIATSIPVVQGSATTSNHMANPGAVRSQVKSVGN